MQRHPAIRFAVVGLAFASFSLWHAPVLAGEDQAKSDVSAMQPNKKSKSFGRHRPATTEKQELMKRMNEEVEKANAANNAAGGVAKAMTNNNPPAAKKPCALKKVWVPGKEVVDTFAPSATDC